MSCRELLFPVSSIIKFLERIQGGLRGLKTPKAPERGYQPPPPRGIIIVLFASEKCDVLSVTEGG